MPDAEYDRAFNELKALEARFPELKSRTSPTLRVGGAVRTGFKKVRHDVPMLSIHTETDFSAAGAAALMNACVQLWAFRRKTRPSNTTAN